MLVVEDKLKSALKEYFGFDGFKGTQEQVIQSLLAGNDTFVIMPTGGGKSLCYQLPAIISEGTAIVVSPLIALMKNQVDLIRSYSSIDNIAHFMNSSLNKSELKQVKEDLVAGHTKLLYVAPETLTKQENIDFFKEIKISFIAVDEAHCISEWGHDFRPEYRRIRGMIEGIGQKIPIIALTATATPKVQSDIVKTLHLEDPAIFISSFNRENLYYEVRPKGKKDVMERQIVQFIKNHEGKSGIIYVLSRKSTEEVAQLLNVNGIKAAPYHAGLEAGLRAKTQDNFLMEEIDVIVATIAFGMGIDKPDIRFVIHHSIPKSIENYYQETGRAGRDGLEGNCLAFYSHKDINKLEKFMRDKPLAEREMGGQLLMEMEAYAESALCRRRFILHYFGEEFGGDDSNCGMCDNCRNPKEKIEGQEHILDALKVIKAVKETQSISTVVNILLGKKGQDIVTYNYDKLEQFGIGKDKDEVFWNSIVRQALIHNLIRKDVENYGLLKINKPGAEFMQAPYSIMVAMNHDFSQEEEDQEFADNNKTAALDQQLLGALKDLRRKVAHQNEVPPYIIFFDSSLEDMATQYPTTMDELTKISGVSKGKAERYGKKFIEMIASYVEENDIDRPMDFVMKSVVNKSGLKVYIIQNIDKRIPLDDIADAKGMKLDALLTEIETIIQSGTKVDIDYHIDQVLDYDQQDIIYDYFSESETPSLDVAYDELVDEGVTVEDIQLMRIKFFCENAT